MKIPALSIAQEIEVYLKKQVAVLKKKGKTPHLTTILIGESSEQLSYVSIKRKLAGRLGIEFEFIHILRAPIFEKFAQLLKKYSSDPAITGIIIQQPLPPSLQTDSLYKYIPLVKEIEGHTPKSPFYPPLGLAALTALKYVFVKSDKAEKMLIDIKQDTHLFKSLLKHKRVVLIGRGMTGGAPIGKTLTQMKINYLSINSQTHEPDQYYKDADVIISAVGKKTIRPDNIKPGVILLTAGLRKEDGKLKGDYDEDEVKSVASFYSTTPGGVGPLDVLYLYKNLIDSTQMQLK